MNILLLFSSFFLAAWFKYEIVRFPFFINHQVYQEYQSLYHTEIPFSEFLRNSTLQKKDSRLSYLFFILMPLIYVIFHSSSLFVIIILWVLFYLSLLDCLYYLTDIRYIAIIFILSLCQLLVNEPQWLYEKIAILLFTSIFFCLLIYVLKLCFKKEMFGMGDVLLFIALSPLFKAEEMLLFLLYASLLGVLYSLVYWINTRRKLNYLAFIPFIFSSTLILFYARIES